MEKYDEKNRFYGKKIYRLKISKKPKNGCNSLFLVFCERCGRIQTKWDTEIYNKACPHCKNKNIISCLPEDEVKDNIFRIQRKLYSEYKTNNVLTPKEVELLSSFRETGFESILKNLFADHWFKTRNYTVSRKVEWRISRRGEQLLKNQDFIDLIEECYKLLYILEEVI